MSGSPTASMAQRIVDDDERALEDSYRLYGPMVRSYLRRFVDADEADDRLAGGVPRAVALTRPHRPVRPLEGWLFGIARKRAIDQLRRRRPGVIPMDAVRDLWAMTGTASSTVWPGPPRSGPAWTGCRSSSRRRSSCRTSGT